MAKRMLIDATHPEETRVAVVNGNKLEEYDFETISRKQIKGNIYLVKVTRVEPSLQAAFVDFGGNRHGFLPFPEIHADYYRIPIADRQALLEEERLLARQQAEKEEAEEAKLVAGNIEEIDEVFSEDDHKYNQLMEISSFNLEEEEPDANTQPAAFETDKVVEDEEPLSEEIAAANIAANSELADAEISACEEGDNEIPHEDAHTDGADEDRPVKHFSKFKRYKIQEVIKRNQIMLVQISKEERGNKGAAATSYISLPGRYCVLMPNSPRGGGVSRKVTNIKDRQRLKKILKNMNVPEGMSVILRTAAIARSDAEIKRDLEYLLRLWNQIRELTLKSTAPAMIYEEGNLIKRAIRDLYKNDIEEVIIAGKEAHETASEFTSIIAPNGIDRLQCYNDEFIPLFSRYQVEKQINEIHNTNVQLKSGGYIVINPTEALVAIDVNSGKATKGHHIEETALKTNLEAAEEIARQLRLRDQGGLVVVDFIDMEEPKNNRLVERKMKEAMQSDRSRIQMGRMSAFGLLELSRQRLNPSLVETNFEVCKHCEGRGVVRTLETTGILVLRAIEEEGVRQRASEIHVSVPTEVALYLFNHKRDMLKHIEETYEIKVFVNADDSILRPNYTIEVVQSEKGEKINKRKMPIQTVDMSDFVMEEEKVVEVAPVSENIDSAADEEPENNIEVLDDKNGNKFKSRRRGSRGGRNRGKSRRGRFNKDQEGENAAAPAEGGNSNPPAEGSAPVHAAPANNEPAPAREQNKNYQPRERRPAPPSNDTDSDGADKRKGWWSRILE